MFIFLLLANNVLAHHCVASVPGEPRLKLEINDCFMLDAFVAESKVCCRLKPFSLQCQVEGPVTSDVLPVVSSRTTLQGSEAVANCFVHPKTRQCLYIRLTGETLFPEESLVVSPNACTSITNSDNSKWTACCDDGDAQENGQASLTCRSEAAYGPHSVVATDPAIEQVPASPSAFSISKPWYGGVYCYQKAYHAP